MAYVKLFDHLVTSTIWSEDDKTRILWITLLAVSDVNGECNATIPGLARLANMDIGDVEHALERLQQPDPYSRTKDYDGRRVDVGAEGLITILNHGKYRELGTDIDRRRKNAERQRRFRERQKAAQNGEVTESVTVTEALQDSDARFHKQKQSTEADTYKDESTRQSGALTRSRFDDFWKEWPKKRRKKQAREIWLQRLAAGTLPPLPELLAALDGQLKGKAACDRAGQWSPELPDPDNWLRNERWADEPPRPETRTAANTKGNGTTGTANDSDSVRQNIADYQARLDPDMERARAEWTPEKQAAAEKHLEALRNGQTIPA